MSTRPRPPEGSAHAGGPKNRGDSAEATDAASASSPANADRGTSAREWGRCSVSAQIPSLARARVATFGSFGTGEVAYARIDGFGARASWIAVGNPLVAEAAEPETSDAFREQARSAGARASFFGVEGREGAAPNWKGFQALLLGDEPLYRTAEWPRVLASRGALRYQLARARRRGVSVAPGAADARPLLDAAALRRRMPTLDFVVRWSEPTDARTFVARVGGEGGTVVGLAVVREVPAVGRWFVEHLLRSADAPNGATELLFDAVIRAGAAEGVGEISLGLVPLSPSLRLPGPLRAARKLGALFYDFDGLNHFKAKLAPQERRPIYYMHDAHVSPVVAVGDLLRAFAGGSLRRFAFRTAIHGVRRLESLRAPS